MSLKVYFKFMRSSLWLVLAASAAFPGLAHADRRAYGVTYEAVTAPKGELDVETWSTFSDGEVDGGPASRGVREMVEVEYGITDRWDIALYNKVDAITSGDTDSGYAGFAVETRYRLSDRGQWPVDPVLYFEAQERLRGDAEQSYEAKLILAHDFGRMNVAVNGSVEEERTMDPAWNTEVEYAGGASYELSSAIKLGAETFGKAEKSDTGGIENRTWAGPAVSWARGMDGAMHGLWVTLAAGAGVAGEADPFYGRAVVGLQF